MNRFMIILCLLGICLIWDATIVPAQFIEAGVEKYEIPVNAPDFTLDKFGGGTVSLKELKGKLVLLNFFSLWCDVCRKEALSFDKLDEIIRNKKVVFLQIAVEGAEKEIATFNKEFKLSLPILMDKKGSIAKAYNLFGHPETYFINREGKIIGKAFQGGQGWTSPNMINLIQKLAEEGKQ